MNGSSLAPLSPGSSFADVGSRLSDQDKVFREESDNATRLRSAWETQKRWINIFYTLVTLSLQQLIFSHISTFQTQAPWLGLQQVHFQPEGRREKTRCQRRRGENGEEGKGKGWQEEKDKVACLRSKFPTLGNGECIVSFIEKKTRRE